MHPLRLAAAINRDDRTPRRLRSGRHGVPPLSVLEQTSRCYGVNDLDAASGVEFAEEDIRSCRNVRLPSHPHPSLVVYGQPGYPRWRRRRDLPDFRLEPSHRPAGVHRAVHRIHRQPRHQLGVRRTDPAEHRDRENVQTARTGRARRLVHMATPTIRGNTRRTYSHGGFPLGFVAEVGGLRRPSWGPLGEVVDAVAWRTPGRSAMVPEAWPVGIIGHGDGPGSVCGTRLVRVHLHAHPAQVEPGWDQSAELLAAVPVHHGQSGAMV